jgi:hypothetical protein
MASFDVVSLSHLQPPAMNSLANANLDVNNSDLAPFAQTIADFNFDCNMSNNPNPPLSNLITNPNSPSTIVQPSYPIITSPNTNSHNKSLISNKSQYPSIKTSLNNNNNNVHLSTLIPFNNFSSYNPASPCDDLHPIPNTGSFASSSPASTNHPSTIINLSSFDLDPPTHHLLDKGFNFAIIPHWIHVEDIIFSIESIMQNLPTHEAEEIWQECGRIIRCSKPPKPNLAKEKFQSIWCLNVNPNIIILKVDKGNASVIMNTSDYESKIYELLSSSSYKPLNKNPIN